MWPPSPAHDLDVRHQPVIRHPFIVKWGQRSLRKPTRPASRQCDGVAKAAAPVPTARLLHGVRRQHKPTSRSCADPARETWPPRRSEHVEPIAAVREQEARKRGGTAALGGRPGRPRGDRCDHAFELVWRACWSGSVSPALTEGRQCGHIDSSASFPRAVQSARGGPARRGSDLSQSHRRWLAAAWSRSRRNER